MTAAQQVHLAMVREMLARIAFERMFAGMTWGRTGTIDDHAWREAERRFLQDADAILALTGEDGKRLLLVLDPDQKLRESDFTPDEYSFLMLLRLQGWRKVLPEGR